MMHTVESICDRNVRTLRSKDIVERHAQTLLKYKHNMTQVEEQKTHQTIHSSNTGQKVVGGLAGRLRLRPAVATAEQTEKVRPRSLDLAQTDLNRRALP
jgi:hypothetical protein